MTKYRYADAPEETDPKVLRHYRMLQDIRSEGYDWKGRPDQDLLNHARVMAYYEVIDRHIVPSEEASTSKEPNSKMLMLQR